MDVTKTMLSAVMTEEERKAYLPAYRKVLAEKHVLARAQKRINKEVSENSRKASSLELLTGGLPLSHRVAGTDMRRMINGDLAHNWFHPLEPQTQYYYKMLQNYFEESMPFTEEDMDSYAEATVDLFEYTDYADNLTFWFWAAYSGDYKVMIRCEAEAAGFVKKEK